MAYFSKLTTDIEVSVTPKHWEKGDAIAYYPIRKTGAVDECHFELKVWKGVEINLRYLKRGKSEPLFFWWQPLAQEDAATDLPGDGVWNNEFTFDNDKPFLLVETLVLHDILDIDTLRLKSATGEVIVTMKFHVTGYKEPQPGDVPLKPYVYDPADHLDSFREDGDKYKEDNGKHLHALLRQLRHNI